MTRDASSIARIIEHDIYELLKKEQTVTNLIIYLASPYGFTDSGREFMQNTMIPSIKKNKSITILNPWDNFNTLSQEFQKIVSLDSISKQKAKLWSLNKRIGKTNENLIKKSNVMIAILDGTDIDSGVAAEVGYAFALGKKILGYRSDMRLTGDNLGTTVNLQVEYFVTKSGGRIVSNITELKQSLKELLKYT